MKLLLNLGLERFEQFVTNDDCLDSPKITYPRSPSDAKMLNFALLPEYLGSELAR